MNALNNDKKIKLLFACWALSGGILLLGAALTIPMSAGFGYDTYVIDMPLITLFVALFAIGIPFLILPVLTRKTLTFFEQMKSVELAGKNLQVLFFSILVIGLLARLLMLFAEPLMEDDYQRYLWDGALVANGYNPYEHSPKGIISGSVKEPGLVQLGEQSGKVLERINHPSLRTIYPPVAQFGFATAYWLKPFSLTAWKLVAIFCELISIALLLTLLKRLDRSRLWSVLYWWNPLVIKELVNSAHMEVLLVPLLLGALLAATRKAPKLTSFLLALAVGVKIWPGLLLPLYLRPFLAKPQKLVLPLAIFIGLIALMFWPVLVAGLDQSSGFVAYAQNWKTNSALFPFLEFFMRQLVSLVPWIEPGPQLPARLARGLITVTLAGLAIFIAWRPARNGQDLARKTLFITAAMFLLSPAQLPWYAAWFLPFMVFFPLYGLALLVPLLQFYYLSFYIAARDISGFQADVIVWLIWIPVWAVLAFEIKNIRSGKAHGERSSLQGGAP